MIVILVKLLKKINLENNKFEIFSKGHRNIQGLYFDKSKNIILATEHGPKGVMK